MTRHGTKGKNRSRYFDRFVFAGLLMNILVVLWLVGFWLLH